jgi:hypothetical protein
MLVTGRIVRRCHQRGGAVTAVDRCLPHGAVRDNPLPRPGPEKLGHALSLILPGLLLAEIVRNVVAVPPALPGGRKEVGRGPQCELRCRGGGRSFVVQVVGIDRIEKAVGSLVRRGDHQAGGAAQRSRCGAFHVSGRHVGDAGIERAGPSGIQPGLRANFDNSTTLEPELGRDVRVEHMNRGNGRGTGRNAEQSIEPFVNRDSILNVQEAVVHTANVHQPVVFRHEAGQTDQGTLDAVRRQRLLCATYGIAGDRCGFFRGQRPGIAPHHYVFLQGRANLQDEFDRQRAANDDVFTEQGGGMKLDPDDVRAGRDIGDLERPVRCARARRHGGAGRILKHDSGTHDRLPAGVEHDSGDRGNLQLRGRARGTSNATSIARPRSIQGISFFEL